MDQLWASLLEAWAAAKSVLALLATAGISLSAVAAAAYALFKLFGEKWLDQKFAEQLESYRAEQARQLERLRHRMNGVFDRTKRLHDREFEVLPGIWAKLVDAKIWADGYLALFQQYADVSRMEGQDLDEFLDTTAFSSAQKRQIKSAPNKQNAYITVFERHRYSEVRTKISEASVALKKDGIFVLPPVRNDMARMLEIIHSAVVEHQINTEEDVRPRMRDGRDKLKAEGEPLFAKIEEAVASRLWDSITTEV